MVIALQNLLFRLQPRAIQMLNLSADEGARKRLSQIATVVLQLKSDTFLASVILN